MTQDAANVPEPHPSWGTQNWSEATVREMRDHLDRIGPPWGNSKLLAQAVIEGFWIAYEALERLEPEARS